METRNITLAKILNRMGEEKEIWLHHLVSWPVQEKQRANLKVRGSVNFNSKKNVESSPVEANNASRANYNFTELAD